jgi:segregation and condensation protein A
MAITIELKNFSGPLDLLLQLIKDNEMDIYDIQIVEVTDQYLKIIEQMHQLDLEVASEFLLMAATLIHIKSRMLLPVSEELIEEGGEDPRAELIRRLLEYQRYKEAAALFQEIPQLGRDVFFVMADAGERPELESEDSSLDAIGATVGVYQLAEAFYQLLNNRPKEIFHEVVQESLSVADYIILVAQRLKHDGRVALREFFSVGASRDILVVTFLAMLELVKMRMINIEQMDDFSDIWLAPAVTIEELDALSTDEALMGYG